MNTNKVMNTKTKEEVPTYETCNFQIEYDGKIWKCYNPKDSYITRCKNVCRTHFNQLVLDNKLRTKRGIEIPDSVEVLRASKGAVRSMISDPPMYHENGTLIRLGAWMTRRVREVGYGNIIPTIRIPQFNKELDEKYGKIPKNDGEVICPVPDFSDAV